MRADSRYVFTRRERLRLRVIHFRYLVRYSLRMLFGSWRIAGLYVEDEERLIYGDPEAPEPVGVLHAEAQSVRIDTPPEAA